MGALPAKHARFFFMQEAANDNAAFAQARAPEQVITQAMTQALALPNAASSRLSAIRTALETKEVSGKQRRSER